MDLDNISNNLGKEGMTLIKDICDVAYTRLPGSENEKKAQQFMVEKFKSFGVDDVSTREYGVYSKFFLWWPRISILLFYGSIALYLFFPLLSFIFIVIGALNLVFKIFSYTVLDVFFKKNPSSNVIAKLKPQQVSPSGKAKMIMIIGGHIDSNYEYPIGKKYGTKMIKVVIPVIVGMLVWILFTLIHVIITLINGEGLVNFTASAWELQGSDWLLIPVLFLIPYATWVGFWMVINLPVPGANDNLSGVAVTAEIIKYFAQHPKEKPKHIEIWTVSFGSEEGGMIGSKEMAKDVRAALDHGTFPAEKVWVVNWDSIAANGPIFIAKSEPMYRAKHDPKVVNQLVESAKNANVDYIAKTLAAGTDSAPFSRLKIPAVGMVCFGDGSSPANWHSRDDTPENCDVRGLIHSIKLGLQFILDVDQKLDSNAL